MTVVSLVCIQTGTMFTCTVILARQCTFSGPEVVDHSQFILSFTKLLYIVQKKTPTFIISNGPKPIRMKCITVVALKL